MKKIHAALAGALILASGVAAPLMVAAAQSETENPGEPKACLQNDLVWSFDVVNDRTLIVTDRNNNRFTVNMTGGCVGLRNAVPTTLRFVTRTSLGCMGQGDRVAYRDQVLGPMSCLVRSVEPAPPPPKEPKD